MFPRILFEVYVVNRDLAKHFWLPIILITVAGLAAAFMIFKLKKGKPDPESITLKNPLDFWTAIKFAIFYAAIQWLVKFCSEEFGDNGTYLAGAVSGITDVDAITLSMAKLAKGNENNSLAINTILLAALSNTLVKFIIVMVAGSKAIRKPAMIGFGVIFVVGLGYFLIKNLTG
jgi:uncharacterized membrane protein (DUF4010 family)